MFLNLSLRTRLIVAFLLLSVLPLSAVTLYSYTTSVRAFQHAVEREANGTATDISRRMELVTTDVGQRLDQLFESSAAVEGSGTGPPDAVALRARVAPMLGDTAALIDQVEFRPMGTDGQSPAPAPPPPAARGNAHPPVPPPPAVAGAPAPPRPPIVVNVPEILAQVQKSIPKDLSGQLDPQLNEMIRRSVEAGLASADVGAKAAAAAMAHEAQLARAAERMTVQMQGRELQIPVQRNGRMIGHARARLNMDRTLGAILTLARSEQGEIAFAIDPQGRLYTPDAPRRATLESLHVTEIAAAGKTPTRIGEWVVVTKRDPSGLTFGIARPVGESLREIRRASVRNLSLGLVVIGLAIVGIVPISHRMTDRLRSLTSGVRQLAGGDFRARVPVQSADEFGELASAFNQMAHDLEQHQAMVVDRERLRRELELSRRIQTDMLPRGPLRFGAAEIKGVSIPAREVGGDFFNYFELGPGRLGLLVGDVSGKGVGAALLMANVQATLRARLPLQDDLASLADGLDRELDESTPGGVFVTLFIGVLEDGSRTLRYINAGHHPPYVLRGNGRVERLSSTGLPIGLYSGHGYQEARVTVAPGDLLFFYTDGLVETENERGEMFDRPRLERFLVAAHTDGVDAVLERIEREVRQFRGNAEPLDDATLMAMRL